jgi:hypothetical protein
MKVIYYRGKKEWLIYDIQRDKSYHTHVAYDQMKAGQMIVVRAKQGTIPEDYPHWMVDSVNRLWYGKDYLERKDLNNSNLLTNNKEVRSAKKKKEKTVKRSGKKNG